MAERAAADNQRRRQAGKAESPLGVGGKDRPGATQAEDRVPPENEKAPGRR